MTHDLMPRAVQHRHLTLENRDERVGRVADLIQLLAHLGRELLAALGKQGELGTGKHPSRDWRSIVGVKRHTRNKRIQTKPRSEIHAGSVLTSSWLAPQSAPAGHSSADTVRRGLRIPASVIRPPLATSMAAIVSATRKACTDAASKVARRRTRSPGGTPTRLGDPRGCRLARLIAARLPGPSALRPSVASTRPVNAIETTAPNTATAKSCATRESVVFTAAATPA